MDNLDEVKSENLKLEEDLTEKSLLQKDRPPDYNKKKAQLVKPPYKDRDPWVEYEDMIAGFERRVLE